MTEDEILAAYGLYPAADQLDAIREILAAETEDTDLMKVCCIQLFNGGALEDVLRIWAAKKSGWDAHNVVDVQLLCGAGLDATKTFLAAHADPEAREALEYLESCEAAGDFEAFSVAQRSTWYAEYYGVPARTAE